jgi:addiction module HigA family antidote
MQFQLPEFQRRMKARLMFTIKRPPVTPGEILREEFLVPYALSQTELAERLACDVKTINRIVNGRQAISAEMALKLGGFFRTTPEFWLNLQREVDLYHARQLVRLPVPVSKTRATKRHAGNEPVPRVAGQK